MASGRSDAVARMRSLAAELPAMVVDGFRAGRELSGPFEGKNVRLFAAGLGASAAAADLAGAVLEPEAPLTLQVVRGDDLPKAADSRSCVLVISYSGETTEAIRAYAAAGRRGARRVVLTSGGALGQRAEADGVPVVRAPPGLPPRSAIGFLLGGALGVLDPVFPESNEARVRAAAEVAQKRGREFGAPGGLATTLATGIGNRLPFLVADRALGAVVRRWASQLEENAKRLAVWLEAPEMLHNAIVGWGELRLREAGRYAIVLLERTVDPPVVREGMRYLEQLARGRRVTVLSAEIASEDLLEAILSGIVLGDLVSLELAQRRHVDPFPIVAIDRLRARIADTVGSR